MPVNVTEYINNLAASDPKIAANVRKGVKVSTAFFQAVESGNFNASQIVDTANLSPQDRANLNAMNAGISSIGALANGQIPIATGAIAGTVSNVASSISGVVGNVQSSLTTTAGKSKNKGIEESLKQNFTNGATREYLDIADAPTGVALLKDKTSIPILLQSEVKALMVQLGYLATTWTLDYNSPPKFGRYAVHNTTLMNYGYKDSKTGNWSGQDGIKNDNDFLFDNNVQDRIMQRFIVDQYRALIKCNAIRDGDSKAIVGGMIAVSYFFQDAKPSLAAGLQSAGSLIGTLGVGDPTQLVGSAADFTNSATQALEFTGTGTTASLQTELGSVLTNVEKVVGSIPGAAKTGTTTDLTTLTQVGSLKNAAVKAAESVAKSDIAGKLAAKADVSKFSAAASDFAASLPANKAKDWRDTGTGGAAEYYNAGKYAVQTLAADITT